MKVVIAFILLLVNNISFSQTRAIDPEIQRYFENQYGYMKDGDFRNSPVSIERKDLKSEIAHKNSLITYTSAKLPQPDYSIVPLYYDLKKQNTTGSIASYVFNITDKNSQRDVETYTLIDIVISKDNYSSVLNALSRYGFILGGEEVNLEDKESMILFGWIKDKDFDEVSRLKKIERISLSKRNITAPVLNVSLIVKVPNDRNMVIFIESFLLRLSEYGFTKEKVDIISNDKRYRFSILKIDGKLPIDKTKILLKSPFIVEIKNS